MINEDYCEITKLVKENFVFLEFTESFVGNIWW